MEISMKVYGRKIKRMGMGYIGMRAYMRDMKESERMEKNVAMECIFILITIAMKENGKETKRMEKALCIIQVELDMKASEWMI